MADNQDEMIQQFAAVSGANAERAKFFLESAAWNLSTALSSFYEEGGEENPAAVAAAATDSNNAASAAVDDPTLAATAGAAPTGTSSSRTAGSAGPGSSDWLLNEDDSDEDEEGEAFYAGGSQHSGQQVLGPPRKKKDVVAKLFKAAKEHGAQVVSDEQGQQSLRTSFQGTSYRLGETPTDTQVIPDSASPMEQTPQSVELRLWRTGFTVDDGPLRDYREEENARFLTEIKNGRIPLELLRVSRGREVAINMSDHRHDDYVQTRKPLKAFTGSGQTLGSPAPGVVGQVTQVAGPGGSASRPGPAASADPKAQEDEAKVQLSLDASQPTTNVQIRLTDGNRLIVRANHSHTVGDLRRYVCTARPQYSSQPFSLMRAFPHVEVPDDDKTLSQANLLNEAIVVKIK